MSGQDPKRRVLLQIDDLLEGENRDVLVMILKEIRDDQKVAAERIDTVEQDVSETLAKLNALIMAFPGGDMDGHRRYHESVIEWRELRNKMIRAALEKVAGAGALAGCVWIAYALWQALKMEFRK